MRTGRASRRPDDIFFLEVAEIAAVATGQAVSTSADVIRARREEYEQNLTLSPPPVVVGRFDPDRRPRRTRLRSRHDLQGIPVFPGVVTGPARVILRADDHEQVLPGRDPGRPLHGSGVDALFRHRRRRGDGPGRHSLPRQHRGPRIRPARRDQLGLGDPIIRTGDRSRLRTPGAGHPAGTPAT